MLQLNKLLIAYLLKLIVSDKAFYFAKISMLSFRSVIVLALHMLYLLTTKFYSMNWTVIIIVGVLLLALLVFMIRKNQKDEREFEQQLNNDYHKTKDEEGDVETDNSLR